PTRTPPWCSGGRRWSGRGGWGGGGGGPPPRGSKAYWGPHRPGAGLAALASAQSQLLAGREELVRRVEELAARHRDGDVPLPEAWGGYRLVPDAFEFWQGQPNRLPARFRYTRRQDGWL